jgi:isorenieratene synthase
MVPVLLSVVAIALGWVLVPLLLTALIRKRLQGYRVQVNTVDAGKPERLKEPVKVAVVGSGLAGLAAATTLAARGFSVTVFEAAPYLGGKLGSWQHTLPNGAPVWVSHGFHAFFRHYYNLNRFLDARGLRRAFRSIGDYVIIGKDGKAITFAGLSTTPVLNLVSMARKGMFKVREVLFGPARDLMGIFLEYEQAVTFARYDHLSFAQFDAHARLPPSLKLSFNTFSRAFFADEDKLSLAELVKCFHFYYLSQDGGLVYDYPTRDYEPALLAPVRDELLAAGAQVRMGTSVEALEERDAGWAVNGEAFAQVVLATDVVGAKAIMTGAKSPKLPALRQSFERLVPGQRYAVLRLWTDRDVREGLPVFVITDKFRVLDAVATYHRLEEESAAYVKAHGGAVLELHCYAVPEELGGEAELRAAFLDELVRFFPELAGLKVHAEHLQLKRNFTAFHVGMDALRPTVDSGAPGLFFAGDWVKLPFPAMLLEAAFSSGLVAANRILAAHGLREEPVDSVPLKGLMAGMPQPPARDVLAPPRQA